MPETRPQRYPGIYSFAPEQSSLFFGRQADIARLLTLIEVEPQVLLYSRSGLGKTSLLNAGLMPRLDPAVWVTLPLRFYAHGSGSGLSPVRRILQALEKAVPPAPLPADSLLRQLDPGESLLWFNFKQAQAQLGPEKRFVLLFDQFEELFSYPEWMIEEFKQQLYELMQTPVPNGHMQQIMALRRENPERFSREALAALRQPLRLTPLYTIRTDRLALLDRLVDKLVGLREVFHELQPLDADGARRAIEQPAQQAGEFASPAFNFRPEAAAKILHFLSEEGQKAIESTQLQIICARIEAKMQQQGRSEVAVEDVPDFKNVFRDFYTGAIGQLPPAEQASASRMVEDELIRNAQRVSLDENICKGYVSQASLDQLVNARLLRREPNSVGGLSYELSHDTLMEPIGEVAETRRQEEALRAAEAEAEAERTMRRKELQQLRRLRGLLAGVVAALILAIVAFLYAQQQIEIAEEAIFRSAVFAAQAETTTELYDKDRPTEIYYDSVTNLSFRNFNLKRIPSQVFMCANLDSLDLSGNQLADLSTELGKLLNLKSLDLRVNNLTSLPIEIEKLTNLSSLDLRANDLATLPTEIGKLTNLTSFYWGNSRVKEWNNLSIEINELANLPKLTKFEFFFDQLSSLPPEIGRLTQLQELNISYAQLDSLPPEIGQLTQLRQLHLNSILGDYQLSSLPPEIGQLTQLKELTLVGTNLDSLPPELWQLSQLQELNLSGNDLNTLPPEIGQMSQLKVLILYGNKLSSLPPGLWQLTELQELNLGSIDLNTLLPEIGQLSQLQKLSLHRNKLTSLPREIGQLSQLKELNLSGNQLTTLLPHIRQLKNLQKLDIRGNPLLPAEVEAIRKALPDCEIEF